MDKNDKTALERIDDTIKKLKEHDFTFQFFIIDSKNVPNGSMQYSYQLAKTLCDKGYNVEMLYQLENEYSKSELEELKRKEKPIDERRVFTGVGEWLGEEYMQLKHLNILKEKWSAGPADFLFIPEVFPSLMKQTYQFKAPCKRIVLLHNYDYITDYIPFNDEWGTYGIHDAIVNCERQEKLITSVFPYVKCQILSPYIPEYFKKPLKPKKLIVNIISKHTEDVNRIMKQFYWKYPMYKFVTFRDLRGYPKANFAEYLQEAAITVWVDDESPFGYSAVEAMKCGDIVIGKIPEHAPEWMTNDKGVVDNGIWTYDINTIPDILCQVLGSWMQDKIPNVLYDNMNKMENIYTHEQWNDSVDTIINDYIGNRINEFNEIKTAIIAKNKKS